MRIFYTTKIWLGDFYTLILLRKSYTDKEISIINQ